MGERLPDRIGLCPDPDHTGEFYMPHGDATCPYDHWTEGEDPEPLSMELVEYAPVEELERAKHHAALLAQDLREARESVVREASWDRSGARELCRAIDSTLAAAVEAGVVEP